MNSPLWQVFRFEFRRNLRRRGYLFMAVAVPLLALVLLEGSQLIGPGGNLPDINLPTLGVPGITAAGAGERGLVDETGRFASGGDLQHYQDAAAAESALARGEISSWYHIPADYLETGMVTQVLPRFSLNEVSRSAIRTHILTSLADELDAALLARLKRPSRLTVVSEQRVVPLDEDLSLLVIYPFVMALMISLFMTSGYLLQGVIEEKETRVVEILLSSLRPAQLFGGKVLAYGALGLLQLLLWLLGILLILQRLPIQGALALLAQYALPKGAVPLLLLYFVLAYLMFASAYGILGALSASMREGPQYAVIFTLPAVSPLWVSVALLEAPHGGLAVALSLFPLTAPLTMLQRVLITEVPAWQIVLSVILLLLTIAALMWLAGRVFRVHTLLAGRMPRLRELPQLLRS